MPTETPPQSHPHHGPRAELTIQEMAKQSGLSEHTLRYYERIGLLTPIPRDGSSGHRRYAPDTVQVVESLACLRGTGMSIADMRRCLTLSAQGAAAATEQKALFAAHQATLACELEQVKARMAYLAGKIAYFEAIEAGDADRALEIGMANRLVGRSLVAKKDK